MLRNQMVWAGVAGLLLMGSVGCARFEAWRDGGSRSDCYGCQTGCSVCEDGSDPAAEAYSDEWYAREAARPIGARQVRHMGKYWPPYPRPVGEKPQLSHRYHAAHYWPHPYNCVDRSYVQEITARQVGNGWRTATTLYHYYFDPETQELTDAGRRQLQWILHHAPANYRHVWVQTAGQSDISQQRLSSVQQVCEEMLHEEQQMPPVALRNALPAGRPADEIVNIRRRELDTMPEPRVEYTSLPTGGGQGQ